VNPCYFSSSSKVWDSIEWVFGIGDAGYQGWEIVADGNYRLDNPAHVKRIDEVLQSTRLKASVHAPYGDLNLATLNYPIWRESVKQVCTCIRQASAWTERVTIHPGWLSPVGKMMPDRAWDQQKTALREIGQCAVEHGVLVCLENMIGIKEFLCRRPEELAGMIDGIDGIGMTIDIGHAHTVGAVRDFLPYLTSASHLHVHDNHGESDEHLAVSDGTIPWSVVGPCIVRDYRGIIVVEGRSLEEGKKSIAVVSGWFS
jgi:sugar phosphate isomerase/epimerase